MRSRMLLVALVLVLAGSLGLAPATAADPPGTLSVSPTAVTAGDTVTVAYTTPTAGAKNWVGVFAPYAAPVDQTNHGAQVDYKYATSTSGSLTFDTTGYDEGTYQVYLLENDGYTWLAQPVTFTVKDDRPLQFVTDVLRLRNARVGVRFRSTVHGLVAGDTVGTTFRKARGPAWLHVDRRGRVRGVPPSTYAGRTAVASVTARNAAGQRATAEVRVQVKARGAKLVPRVKVMSWNLWIGLTRVHHGQEKAVRYLLEHDIDVVGTQESFGGAARRLAKRLGWSYTQPGDDTGVLSRYPIVRRAAVPGDDEVPLANAVVRLDERHHDRLSLWSTHLAFQPYGPYDACFGHYSIKRLLEREAESGRTAQIKKVVARMRGDLRGAGRTPVVLVGDFNAPSHLDWNRRTDRCGYTRGVPWPTSIIPTRAGLTDTFRAVHLDPLAVPGLTWSPIYKTFTGGYDHDDHTGEPEPQDRLDFVYAKGGWRALSSEAVVAGTPALEPNSQDNEWPSDHKGVVTTFRVR